jgi:PAS domain S-box-containing protein
MEECAGSEMGSVARGRDERRVIVAVSASDVEERQKVEGDLELISYRLLVATQAGAIGIWDFDIIENTLVWDDQMYRLYGITPERFSGAYEAWEEGLHPDDLLAEREKLQKAIRGEAEFDTEFRVVWPDDGSIHFIKANAKVLLDKSGRAIRMIGTNSDVTERRSREAELHLAKRNAEAAAQAKSEFLANMSHEIRTPMNAIIGMTELLLGTQQSETQREYQMMVRSSADSLLAILNDILDFSKIESGKLSLDRSAFSLRDRLGETMHLMGVRAAEKNLELAYRIETEVPEMLIGDVGRIQQILLNLVGNAIKFTDSGEVVVEGALESRTRDSVTLHFQVRDTGIGILADKREMIFDSFTQAESSTTRRFGGTGLGLAISRQLVELMNGRTWVESEPNVGSTFHFTLLLEVQHHDSEAPASVQTELVGKNVILVDDNDTNRLILEEMLLGWGMLPTSCAGGLEALEKLAGSSRTGAFDVVLLDHMMPEIDGLATASKITELLGEDAPPILMLSSTDVLHEADTLNDLGIAHRIRKPARASDLRECLVALFGGSRANAIDEQRAVVRVEPALSMRVLVAEDGKINQILATRILENRGHRVTLASNGLEALECVEVADFDVILMDVQMPEMNGLEATAAIRRREESIDGHVPIIAMTASAMKGDRERCLSVGMDDYVSKPVRPGELIAALEKFTPKV